VAAAFSHATAARTTTAPLLAAALTRSAAALAAALQHAALAMPHAYAGGGSGGGDGAAWGAPAAAAAAAGEGRCEAAGHCSLLLPGHHVHICLARAASWHKQVLDHNSTPAVCVAAAGSRLTQERRAACLALVKQLREAFQPAELHV